MEKTKITKKDYFRMIAGVIENSKVENKTELLAFISHELELLNKKSTNRSVTEIAKQKENDGYIEEIYNILAENNRPMTITEIQDVASEKVSNLSNQRISSLLKKLKDSEKIERTELKKKAYFKIK